MSALRTHPVNDILNRFNLESLRYVNLGDSLIFEAIGLAADRACEMHVLAEFVVMMSTASVEAGVMAFLLLAVVVAMLMLQTDAVFLFARTIVKGVQQVVLYEKSKGAEDGAAVHGRQQSFEVGHREGVVEILERLPDHDAHGRGAHVMILQMLGYFVVHSCGI